MEEIESLKELAKREMERIKGMQQPVARVSGPLTCDGPDGYEKNAARLVKAEKILMSRGMTVWNLGKIEAKIFAKGYKHENIMDYFHKPILRSGLIKEVYFLPRWNESKGATIEREASVETGLSIKEFPEEWF